jgi:hypothetical protein
MPARLRGPGACKLKRAGRVHFGLGASTAASEIEIVWPSRIRQVLRDVAGDRVVEIAEPPR